MTLIAHYKCNDNAASTTVLDASGNAYNGTANRNTNSTTPAAFSVTGRIDKALKFDGAADLVSLGTPSGLNLSTFSVACWVNGSFGSGAYNGIICRYAITTNKRVWFFGVSSTNTLEVWIGSADGTAGAQHASVAGFLPTSGWKHAAFAFQAGSGVVGFWVNGVAQTIGTQTYTAINSSDNDQPTVIGAYNATDGRYFAGAVDDVRFYDGVLTTAQVLTIVNGGNGTEAAYPWLTTRRLNTAIGLHSIGI